MNHLRRCGRALWTGEQGSSVIVVILITVVLVVIGGTSVQMALHSNDATTMDRQRLQAVQAAEAGVGAAINRLQRNPACDSAVSAPSDITDGSQLLARYQVRVDPEASTPCNTLNRVIKSWGYAPAASQRSMRHLEVTVQLVPQKGFQFTLFASGPHGIVTTHNNATVDGDIYAENLDQTHNNINADDVISTGSIHTKDNAIYEGTLWAGGNVVVRQNGKIGQSIIAAGSSDAGNVTFENGVSVAKDVKAKGAVDVPTTYSVGGSISANNPNLPAPPLLEKPTFLWDAANYSPAPQVFSSASPLQAHLDANKNNLSGTYRLDAPSSILTMPTKAAITGPLTIVTTGKVAMGTSMAASGGPWQVVVVADNTGTSAITVEKPATYDPNLDVLLWTKGDVELKNMVTMAGAIYANTISIKNGAMISRSESLANFPPPGFDFTQSSAAQFLVVPKLWREVVPGPPPS